MNVYFHKIRLLFFVTIIGMLISCSTKKYIGSFIYQVGETGAFYVDGKLTLNKDGTFNYYRNSALRNISASNKRGFGIYKIEKDTLLLQYTGYPAPILAQLDSLKSDANTKSILNTKKTINNTNDKSIIAMEVYASEDTEDSVPFFIAKVESVTKHSSHQVYGVYGTIDGKAELIVNKSDFPVDLEISMAGFFPVKIRIDESNFDYFFKILMTENYKANQNLHLESWVHGTKRIKYYKDSLKVDGNYWMKSK